MTQEYTPVAWVDETENQVGTVINKARLDQMQTAHHYADGFREVDAVPTQDPGVDYHMVVYCTADTTFYRWDGSQWTKDIDDDTKALLLAHEADHNNPHVVTKAQVGLGNCDNTSDADKPVSTAQQTALDAKVDDTQIVSAWQDTPDNAHIPTEKLVKDSLDAKLDDSQLKTSWSGVVSNDNIPSEKLVKDTIDATDAEVVKIKDGTTTVPNATNATYLGSSSANVGGDLKPIKIVNGQAVAVTNDLLDVSSSQNITGIKTFKANVNIGEVGNPKNVAMVGDLTITGNITQNGSSYETHAEQVFTTDDYIMMRDGATGGLSSGQYSGFQVKKYDGTNDGRLVIDNAGTARVGDVGDEQPLLTRDESAYMTSGALIKWDSNVQKGVTEGTVGSDTRPIKPVNGIALAVSNDLVSKTTDNYTASVLLSGQGVISTVGNVINQPPNSSVIMSINMETSNISPSIVLGVLIDGGTTIWLQTTGQTSAGDLRASASYIRNSTAAHTIQPLIYHSEAIVTNLNIGTIILK